MCVRISPTQSQTTVIFFRKKFPQLTRQSQSVLFFEKSGKSYEDEKEENYCRRI